MKRASKSIQAVILIISLLLYLNIGVYAAPIATLGSTFVMNPSPSASFEGIIPTVNEGNNSGDPNINRPSGGWNIGNWVTASNISDIEYKITVEGKGQKVEWRSKTNALYTGNVVVKASTGFHRYIYIGAGEKSDSLLTGPQWRKDSDDPWELKEISHVTFNFEVVVTTTTTTISTVPTTVVTVPTTVVTVPTTVMTVPTTVMTVPTTVVTVPTTVVTVPTTVVTEPTTVVTEPTTVVTEPTTVVTEPTTVVTEPTTVVTEPTTVVTEPTTVVTEPTTVVTEPTTVVTEPTTVVTEPTTAVTEPTTVVIVTTVVIQTTTTEAPETTTEAPETTTEAPETTTEAPETTTEAPETTTQAPETTTQAPEITTAAIIDELVIPEGGLPPVEIEEASFSQPDEEIVLDTVVPLGDLSLPQTDEQLPYGNFVAGTLLIAFGWMFRKLKV